MSLLSLKRRRDIGRQRWQFIAVLVTVILGVMMFAATFNAYLNLGSSLEETYDRLAMADITVVGADDGFVDTARGVDGVATATDRRRIDVPMEAGEWTFVGRMIGMPSTAQPEINAVQIDDGSYLDPDDPSKVLVETHMAGDFGIAVGDTFAISGTEVTVAGIVTSPEYLWPAKDGQSLFTPPRSFGVVFVDEQVLADLDAATIVDEVLVRYGDEADRDALDDAVTSAGEEASASSIVPLEDQPSNASINLEISGLRTMAIAFPLLFLLAAGLAVYVVLTRLVYSQRGVIGTLRASGFARRTLSGHYRSYGLAVGLVGAATGALLGGILARGLTAVYVQIFEIPDLVAEVHVPTVIIALTFGAVAGVLASAPPARTVANLAPAEAMRGDTPADGGKESVFERVLPPLRRLPIRWRMTLRGLGRNTKRSVTLVLGVVLSLTLILAAWGMMDTMVISIDRQFNEIAIEDATIGYEVPVGTDQVDAVKSIQGVQNGESVIGLSVTVRSSEGSYATVLEGYERATQVHGFDRPLPAEGVLLGRAMGGLLSVVEGSLVDLEFPSLESTITVEVDGFVDEPLGTAAYMASDALAAALEAADPEITSEVLALPGFTSVKAIFFDAADADGILTTIQALDGVAVVVSTNEVRDLIDEAQKFFYVFVGMMILFGSAMAFALIFNIVSVNVAERSSEFASMRANGLAHRKVASMIMGEVAILTAIGIIPGLIVGYLAAYAFMQSFSSEQFPISLIMNPATLVVSAMAMFVVAWLSLVPALRAVKRINVGEVVRERAL